jgi:hypothetical protein
MSATTRGPTVTGPGALSVGNGDDEQPAGVLGLVGL